MARSARSRRWWKSAALLLLILLLAAAVIAWRGVRFSYVPAVSKIESRTRPLPYAFDLWGDAITAADVQQRQLSPAQGLVALDDATAQLGREAFYRETFGNEVFLTDVMGILDGPLRFYEIARAITLLNGRGTTDLVVRCAEDAVIGSRHFRQGEPLHTGIDVPRGSWMPLGMPIVLKRGRLQAGISCAACHSTVDPANGMVIEGASNPDFNAGLLMALASNSASYFMHTDVDPNGLPVSSDTVTGRDGQPHALPDARQLEDSVDAALLQWPPGSFDSMVDLVEAATRIPISWTLGNYPYSWSGAFRVGPFQGLSAQNNNVHALNSDSLILADGSPVFFNMDKEAYLALLLRRSAASRFRYDPQSHRAPSEFFASVDPNPGAPGVNDVVLPPTFPKSTPLGPDGTFTSSPGQPFWRQINAMSVWQHTLVPPVAPLTITPEQSRAGQQVFQRAGCAQCHQGRFLTDNRVHPVAELGTEPARAPALGKSEMNFAGPVVFGFNEPVPLRREARGLPIPLDKYDSSQLALAWNHQHTGGGYKTPALVGLYWRAPYLHDGGVAMGLQGEAGIPATLGKQLLPDPWRSLRALVDRRVRSGVIAANQADPTLRRTHVAGIGHEFWVDAAAGFTQSDQDALLRWLLTYAAL